MSFRDDCIMVPVLPNGAPSYYRAPTTLADVVSALDAAAGVLAANEDRHRGVWRTESIYGHVAHARAHLEVWNETRQAADLTHALTRCLFAVELAVRERDMSNGQ